MKKEGLFIAKGNCRLSINNKEGASFDVDENGGCVVVGKINTDTMKMVGALSAFGDWQAAQYLERILKELNPKRKINIPNFKEMILRANKDNCDICDYCNDLDCRDCIVYEWKENEKNERSNDG